MNTIQNITKQEKSYAKRVKTAQQAIDTYMRQYPNDDEWGAKHRNSGKAYLKDIDLKKYQCINVGAYAVMLNDELEGLPQYDFSFGEPMDINRFFLDCKNYIEVDVGLKDVRAYIKNRRKEYKERGLSTYLMPQYEFRYEVENRLFNPYYLLDVAVILGGKIKYYVDDDIEKSPYAPMLMEGENGRAILLPVRKPKV